MAGLLSLAAQVSQANDSWTSKGLAALPAAGFMLLVKLVFSGLPPANSCEPVAENSAATPASVQDAAVRPSATPAPAARPAPAPVAPTAPAPRVQVPIVASVVSPGRVNGSVVVPQ